MLPTPEQTLAELTTPPENETIATMDAIYAHKRMAIRNILGAEATGEIDEEQANEVIEDVLAGCVEMDADTLGLDLEDIGDEIENIEESGTPIETFGEGLIALIAAEAPSIEEGVSGIEARTGIDRDDVVAICNDEMMPTSEQAEAILGCFECLQADPETVAHLMSFLGEPVEMSRYSSQLEAEFALVAERQAESEAREIERERLAAIDRRYRAATQTADRLLDQKCMTPAERRELLPSVQADDRAEFAAYFSNYAAAAGTSAEQELDRVEYTLNFLERRGSINPVLMADFSLPTTPNLDTQAQEALKDYRARNSYR